MSGQAVHFGPHLIASASGALRRALIVMPSPAIENARPLPGEPNAVHSRARAELEVFAKTLRFLGCDVVELQSRSLDPLASSVADVAIVFESGAAIMRPSSPARRAEAAWIEEEFDQHDVPIAAHLSAPGLLDGSDVVLAGKTAFIGVSSRGNALGRDGFARIAQAHGFSPVEVRLAANVPSLRAVCGVLSEDALVIAPERLDRAAFADFKTVAVERGDEFGAGVLNVGHHHVIADVRFPRVIDALRESGTRVDAIDLYDFGRVGLSPSVLAIDLKRV
jgi:N-dimethylarginine dimethylaminohydrolase